MLEVALGVLLAVAPESVGESEPAAESEPEPEPEPEPDEGDGIPDLGELPDFGELDGHSTVGEPAAPKDAGEPEPLGELEPLPDLGTISTGPRPAPSGGVSDEPEGERFGDIFTGSLRLTGAFLHFDDVPELFPDGDDALLASVFRIMAKRDLGDHFGVELNYFLDLSRVPGGAAATGAFSTAGSRGSVYRYPFLVYRAWEQGSVTGSLGVDRFVVDAHAGPVTVAVGRFPISYTVTGLLTPNDFFSPFAASAVNRIYKPGVDAIRVGSAIGMNTSVEVVGALGFDDGGVPKWGRSGLLARAATVQWGFEWAALGGKVAERWVVGGSSQGDVGPVSLRAEGHVGFPDEDGDGRRGEDTDDPIHVRLSGGPSLNIGWRNSTIGAEYAFVSDGASDPADYLTRIGDLFPDDQPLLARHYVGLNGGVEIVPILYGSVFMLVNGNDGSGLTGLSLLYNVADEADLIAGLFVPWGAEPTITMDPMNPVELRSELGVSPLTVYLEARAFF